MAEGKDRPCFQGGAFQSQVTHLVLVCNWILYGVTVVFFLGKALEGQEKK